MLERNRRIHSRLCEEHRERKRRKVPETDLVKAMHLDRNCAIQHVPPALISKFLQGDEHFSKFVKFVKGCAWRGTPLEDLAGKISEAKRAKQLEARRLVQFYVDHHIPVHVRLSASVRRVPWSSVTHDVESSYGMFRLVHQRSTGVRLRHFDRELQTAHDDDVGFSWHNSPELRKYVWDRLVGVKSKQARVHEQLRGNPGCPLDMWGMHLGVAHLEDTSYVELKRHAHNDVRYRAHLSARLDPSMPAIFRGISAHLGDHAASVTAAFLGVRKR